MTGNEVRQILKQAEKLLNTMDQAHTEKLFQALIGDLHENTKTTFSLSELRKAVKGLIHNCIDMPHPTDWFSYKQIKKIYKILGDYEYYPVCALCGKPIKIDLAQPSPDAVSYPLMFSWDHITPKSLGGETKLRNLQPAHKICNNHKGRTAPDCCHVHYDIKINASVKFSGPECVEPCNKHKNAQYSNLRKQDTWCHKHKKASTQHQR